jgi:hypothetical protein
MDLNDLLKNIPPDHDPETNWEMIRKWRLFQYLNDCSVQELVNKEEESTLAKMINSTEEDRELAAYILKDKLGIS